jgi:hypothetical protein
MSIALSFSSGVSDASILSSDIWFSSTRHHSVQTVTWQRLREGRTTKITRLPPRDFDLRKRQIGNSGAFFGSSKPLSRRCSSIVTDRSVGDPWIGKFWLFSTVEAISCIGRDLGGVFLLNR